MSTFNPPATAELCREAIDACDAHIFGDAFGSEEMLLWIGRSKQLTDYGRLTWPDEFPPPEDDDE